MTKDGSKREVKYPVLGANLRQLRLSRDLTQQGVATELGFVRNTYAMWEGGFSRPDPDAEQKIVAFYDTTVDALYRGDSAKAAQGQPSGGADLPAINKQAAGNSADEWKEKYYGMLEKQEARAVEIGTAAALAVAKELAANHPTRQEHATLGANLNSLAEKVEAHLSLMLGFQLFAIDRLAALEKVAPEVLDIALNNQLKELAKLRNGNRKALADM